MHLHGCFALIQIKTPSPISFGTKLCTRLNHQVRLEAVSYRAKIRLYFPIALCEKNTAYRPLVLCACIVNRGLPRYSFRCHKFLLTVFAHKRIHEIKTHKTVKQQTKLIKTNDGHPNSFTDNPIDDHTHGRIRP